MTAALFFINYPSIHPFLFIFFELGCPYPPYVPRADYLEDLKVFLDDIYEVCHLDISYFKQQICEPDCSDSLQCRLVCHLKKKIKILHYEMRTTTIEAYINRYPRHEIQNENF